MNLPIHKSDDSDFVLNFTQEEIKDIKNDILLYRQGYFFFYAIDTYDIISHYLPYTDIDIVNSKNKNIVSQKAVAYEKFFTTFLNNKLIILDEYKTELVAAKSHIERQIKNSGILNNNIEKIKEEIASLKHGGKLDRDILRKNIELILFLLILSENKNNIYRNFFDFVKNKLSIFTFNTGDERRDRILESVFNDCKPTTNVEPVFDKFVDNIAFYLSKLDSDLERYTYVENSFRDVEVIDRLNSVNNRLHHDYPEQKAFFIYLSSAPYKSKEIISIFKKRKASENRLQNEDLFSTYHFHRNIFQCFLFKILIEEFPDVNDPKPLLILNSLEGLADQRKTLSSQVTGLPAHQKNNQHVQMLNQIMNRYSSNIDNHFYFKIYNKYQALFDLTKPETGDGIAEILKDVNDYLQKEHILSDGQDILFNIYQYKQTHLLTKLMDPKSDSFSINIRFGKDIVRDSFHHLPYLLLINDRSLGELANHLYPLFQAISEIAYTGKSNVNNISPHIRGLLREVAKDNKNITHLAIRFLLTTYLHLIVDVSEDDHAKKNTTEDKELEIIEVLKKQKKMLENAAIRFEMDEHKTKLAVVKKDITFSREFDYLILWLLRRNERLTEAISLGNELVAAHNDGRFYHGLALSNISQAYKLILDLSLPENISSTGIEYFETALLWLRKAKEAYQLMVPDLKDQFALKLVYKTLMAVSNSIADTSIRKYSMLNQQNDIYLIEAKDSICDIKSYCLKVGVSYDNLSIYNFTEAEVIYFDAVHYFSQAKYSEATLNLKNATDRYYVASMGQSSMHDKFKNIKERMDVLRNEIFVKKGSF